MASPVYLAPSATPWCMIHLEVSILYTLKYPVLHLGSILELFKNLEVQLRSVFYTAELPFGGVRYIAELRICSVSLFTVELQ